MPYFSLVPHRGSLESFEKVVAGCLLAFAMAACAGDPRPTSPPSATPASLSNTPMNPATIASGRQIFRFDTYGDESYWTDTLRMHEVIASSVSPATALAVGLKVDMDALPAAVVHAKIGRAHV